MTGNPTTRYPHNEKIFDIITHFFAVILSLTGLALFVKFVAINSHGWHFSILACSLILLGTAAVIYRGTWKRTLRQKFNALDYAAIYILIAGAYTPYCLLVLNETIGWILFNIIWSVTLIGILLSVSSDESYYGFSTIAYVLISWVAIFTPKSSTVHLLPDVTVFIWLGSLSYFAGAIFLSLHKLRHNRMIFYLLVLTGTVFHCVSVL